ncbi:hypothetical protein CFP56_025294 [Quercus suber]|uniref:Uncharacterized protein n=1 Tax=Quercus suber TaxID=58331 RepID=A0AAW0K4C1_QUESU
MAVESSTALALVPQEEDSVSQATSLLPCSRKRRRTTTDPESEEEGSQFLTLIPLQDNGSQFLQSSLRTIGWGEREMFWSA